MSEAQQNEGKNKLVDSDEHSVSKQELEVWKLRREVDILEKNYAELNKPWYQKSQWIGILIPIIVATATLIIAQSTGFLQAQSTLNKIQEENFRRSERLINDSMKTLKNRNDSIIEVRNVLIDQLSQLQSLKDTLFGDLHPNDSRFNHRMIEYIKVKKNILMCDSIARNAHFNIKL